MSKETRLCFARTSLAAALIASVFLAGVSPAFSQAKKSSDDEIQPYNEATAGGDSATPDYEPVDDGGGGGGGGENGTMQKGFRAGTSPYTKKMGDGTTVRRNSDGSIETWDEGETHHYSGGSSGGSTTHKKSTKRKTSSTSSKAKTTVVKKKAK